MIYKIYKKNETNDILSKFYSEFKIFNLNLYNIKIKNKNIIIYYNINKNYFLSESMNVNGKSFSLKFNTQYNGPKYNVLNDLKLNNNKWLNNPPILRIIRSYNIKKVIPENQGFFEYNIYKNTTENGGTIPNYNLSFDVMKNNLSVFELPDRYLEGMDNVQFARSSGNKLIVYCDKIGNFTISTDHGTIRINCSAWLRNQNNKIVSF